MSQNEENNKTQTSWLGWLEGASIAGAVGAAIATGQSAVMLSTLPLSLAAALSFVNRQRMQSDLQRQIMLTIECQDQNLQVVKQDAEALAGTDRILMIQLNTTNNKIEEVHNTLAQLQSQIGSLEAQSAMLVKKQSELLESTLEESYYRRGLELEKRGEFKDAIAAYTEALRVNPNYAQAYMQLGSAYANSGQKQQAIAHLRTATKLFFESGDLDNYHAARELSETVHAGETIAEPAAKLASPEPSSDNGKRLAVDELFV
ncbi:tetratricopeptide repeat protein [Altericista sp. CCNU0014]|uniref:tetratricopeptide repeat protein n=1 Tax=Altericista sp. CCNU0014 TaxID=3082949 RepID=UPI00384FD314